MTASDPPNTFVQEAAKKKRPKPEMSQKLPQLASSATQLPERYYEFGGFRLYPLKRLLLREDQRVALTPKAFDTLRILVANHPNVVSKEQLMREVWPDTLVEEGGLARNISVLRRILDDSSDTTAGHIATIPGRGYQFVAEVLDFYRRAEDPSNPPVLGREAELEQLRAALRSVLADEGSLLVCLSGEAGIGKTTLAENFLREVASGNDHLVVARSRCSRNLAGTGAALPWIELLVDLGRNDGTRHRANEPSIENIIRSHASGWYRHLSTPSIEHTEEPESPWPQHERLKLELYAMLYEANRHRPLILFLDDLHFADATTSDLLCFIADRFKSLKLLVVATIQPTQMAASQHALAELMAQWVLHRKCRLIPLTLFESADVEKYIDSEFGGHQFSPLFAAMVHRRTGGNPLFISQFLETLRTHGLVARKSGRWILTRPLTDVERLWPDSITPAIEAKLAQLGKKEWRLLQAATVQGRDFDSATVATALEWEPQRVEEMLAKLQSQRAIVSFVHATETLDGATALHYRFVHGLYQEAISAQLPPARLATLRQRIRIGSVLHAPQRAIERHKRG